MSLEPLLSASPYIVVHAFIALAAFGIGIAQFAGRKGTTAPISNCFRPSIIQSAPCCLYRSVLCV
jgi:hypothetical protein